MQVTRAHVCSVAEGSNQSSTMQVAGDKRAAFLKGHRATGCIFRAVEGEFRVANLTCTRTTAT